MSSALSKPHDVASNNYNRGAETEERKEKDCKREKEKRKKDRKRENGEEEKGNFASFSLAIALNLSRQSPQSHRDSLRVTYRVQDVSGQPSQHLSPTTRSSSRQRAAHGHDDGGCGAGLLLLLPLLPPMRSTMHSASRRGVPV